MQKCEISRERMKATIFIDHSNGRKRIVEKGVVVLAVVFFFRRVVGSPTLYLWHTPDHVLLLSKPSTVCSLLAFNRVNGACYSFFQWTIFRFFEDRSKGAYGIKNNLNVELLQCAFLPCPIPLAHRVSGQGQPGRDGGFVGRTLVGQHFQ